MHFRLFSLHPKIFQSFFQESLIARAVSKNIISYQLINWRDRFGAGNRNQVDDKPYGGGSGMVLQAEPIFKALHQFEAVSSFFNPPTKAQSHQHKTPNNCSFFESCRHKKLNKATIYLTPRGFTLNQKICNWLSSFQELNLICGRYEGFDARVSEMVDLELSIGNYIVNGGEVACMVLIESLSRLLPGFLVKPSSSYHDSFSQGLNSYLEQQEYIVGKKNLQNLSQNSIQNLKQNSTQNLNQNLNQKLDSYPKNIINTQTKNLFNNQSWYKYIFPCLEHQQYTRPKIWQNWEVPQVLVSGNHSEIDKWRKLN
jgi:tRNA (guanine37-N1)-methyltransferase